MILLLVILCALPIDVQPEPLLGLCPDAWSLPRRPPPPAPPPEWEI